MENCFLCCVLWSFLVLSSVWRKVDHLSLLQTCLNSGVGGLCCSKETATVKPFRIGVISGQSVGLGGETV